MVKNRFSKILNLGAMALSLATLSACGTHIDDSSSNKQPVAAYCPYVTSPRSFTSSMTVTGTARYQYRIDGNGMVPDGTNAFKPVTVGTSPITTSLRINNVPVSSLCSSDCTLTNIVQKLVTDINNTSGLGGVKAHGLSAVGLYRPSGAGAMAVTNLSNLAFIDANPIRYAEVRVTNAAGDIVQCAETNASGQFSLSLPNDGAAYRVSVLARSSNASNTAYVMNNPTDNQPYALTQTVQSTSGAALNFLAMATGTLEGAAFNILDQIAKTQEYLRAQTANCNNVGSANYFQGCRPFTVAPMVYAYWTPGIAPGTFFGSNSGASFYLNGERELYILGGKNGDTTVSDMDHFDNTIIIHEYGHFIEDQYGRPDSPGGTHNGRYIIDPRLAWSEGWANYLQATVTGIPYYRDTSGYVATGCGTDCSESLGFMEPLQADTRWVMHDLASDDGEGNFREFSISRILWAVTRSTSPFAEVWSAIAGNNGMRYNNNEFNSVSSFHVARISNANATNWTTALSNEKHRPNLTDYTTPLTVSASCSPATVAMPITKESRDTGSFATADQFHSNDFYVYQHTGGALSVQLAWSGSDAADLDLYVYKPNYVFGDSTTMAGKDDSQSNSTSGAASVSGNLAAGTYLINVMGYTGIYGTLGVRNTTYSLSINGVRACPAP